MVVFEIPVDGNDADDSDSSDDSTASTVVILNEEKSPSPRTLSPIRSRSSTPVSFHTPSNSSSSVPKLQCAYNNSSSLSSSVSTLSEPSES